MKDPIIQKGSYILSLIAKTVPIDAIKTPLFQNILISMKNILDAEEDGIALAAPQINQSWRIFIIEPKAFKNTKNKPLVFINPEIITTSKKKEWITEGCLSIRDWYGKTHRYKQVTVRAYNKHAEKFEFGGSGLIAQIFQHEIDHLDGVLFDEHAKELEKITPENHKEH